MRTRKLNILIAAASAAVAASNVPLLAGTSKNTAGPVQQGQTAGVNNPAVTISLSGQTALRNFTGGPSITLLQPGTSITLHNGTGGAPVVYTAPATGSTSVQLAAKDFTLADVGVGTSANVQRHSAIRLEWHEQGSLDGFYDLINDQVGYTAATGPLSNYAIRGPSVGNPTWINQTSFTTGTTLNGHTLAGGGGAAFYDTYDPAVYDLATGTNLKGGQNRIQIAIGEPSRVNFAFAGAASPFAKPGTPGYGQGNPALTPGSTLAGTGTKNVRQQFQPTSVADLSTDKVNPQSSTGSTYAAGPWNTAGQNNVDSIPVAATAVTFSANPGTGLQRLNLTDTQWLQTAGRLQNGADFNTVSRVANTGQRNVPAAATGIDPTWAVGENDGGDTTTSAQAAAQKSIGPNIRFSGKTSGTESRNAIAQSRLGVGTLSVSEARGASSAAPVRTLDVDFIDAVDPVAGGTTDYSNFTHLNFDSFVNFTYKAILISHYNTIKAPNQSALDAQLTADGINPAAATPAQQQAAWAKVRSFNPSNLADPKASGIKGDPTGDVAAFIGNIVNSIGTAATGITAASAANPADGLLVNGYFLPGLLNYRREYDGGPLTPNPLTPDQQAFQAFIAENYPTIFTTDGSFGSSLQTIGSGATYGALGISNAASGAASTTNGAIAITAKDAAGNPVANGVFAPKGNYLFGNFNQDGRRDFASVKEAVNAALSLHKVDGAANSLFQSDGGVANATVVASLAGSPGWAATANTKGDLITLGDYNSDGRFDGQDLFLLARGASLSDNAGTDHLTAASGPSFADQVRNPNARLNKNAALDYINAALNNPANADQAFLRVTARATITGTALPAGATLIATNTDGTVVYTFDPAGANAFDKRDTNRDGLLNLNDAFAVDKFFGQNYRNLEQQLAATLNVDGTINPSGTQRQLSLVDVELNDNAAIDQTDLDVANTALAGAGNESWAGTRTKVGGGNIVVGRTGGTVSVAAGAKLVIASGSFTAGGTLDPFTDSTTAVHLDVQNDSAGAGVNRGLVVSAGSKVIGQLAGSGSAGVAAGASLSAASVKQGLLDVAGTLTLRSGGGLSVVKSLSITGAGKLDVTDNSLLVDYAAGDAGVAATVRGYLASAYDHGKWDLPGLTTSAAGARAGSALGYVDTADFPASTFGASVDATGVLVRYTWYGDANLDGAVNGADAALLNAGFASQLATWKNGDFNYDGKISADDFALFSLGLSLQTGVLTAVPEPASLAPLGVVALTLSAHTRRRRGARRA